MKKYVKYTYYTIIKILKRVFTICKIMIDYTKKHLLLTTNYTGLTINTNNWLSV
jgi:hypothetical protein